MDKVCVARLINDINYRRTAQLPITFNYEFQYIENLQYLNCTDKSDNVAEDSFCGIADKLSGQKEYDW